MKEIQTNTCCPRSNPKDFPGKENFIALSQKDAEMVFRRIEHPPKPNVKLKKQRLAALLTSSAPRSLYEALKRGEI